MINKSKTKFLTTYLTPLYKTNLNLFWIVPKWLIPKYLRLRSLVENCVWRSRNLAWNHVKLNVGHEHKHVTRFLLKLMSLTCVLHSLKKMFGLFNWTFQLSLEYPTWILKCMLRNDMDNSINPHQRACIAYVANGRPPQILMCTWLCGLSKWQRWMYNVCMSDTWTFYLQHDCWFSFWWTRWHSAQC